MYLTFRLRSVLALCTALLLVTAFVLPPAYPAGEAAEAAAFDGSADVLVIDAGHGGADGGAVASDGTVESGINLAIAKRLESLAALFGVSTVMTRESEEIGYPEDADTLSGMKKADQYARLKLINSVPRGALISIHQNFYPDARPRGVQVLYAASEGSQALGETAHALLSAALSPDSRRVAAPAERDIYLMRGAKLPAILVECGFISNPEELGLLKSGNYQSKIAALLLASYLRYASERDGISV